MRVFAVAALLLIAPAIATAQPSLTRPTPPLPEPATVAPVKNEGHALALAIGGTLVGVGITVAAVRGDAVVLLVGVGVSVIGPSAGHLYAGANQHAFATSVGRIGAAAVFIKGVLQRDKVGYDCEFANEPCVEPDNKRQGTRLMWIGGILYAGITIYDIVDARYAARRTNARHRVVMVAPSVISGAHGPAPAVSFVGSF